MPTTQRLNATGHRETVGWTSTEGTSGTAALSDGLDTTWVKLNSTPEPGVRNSITYEVANPTLAANQRIARIRPCVRLDSTGTIDLYLQLWKGTATYVNLGYHAGPISVRADWQGDWRDTDLDGAPWDATNAGAIGVGAWDNGAGAARPFLYELYAEAEIQSQGSVSGIAPSGAATSRTPTFSWTYTDPDGVAQASRHVKVFTEAQYTAAGFSPDTSVPLHELRQDANAPGTSAQVGSDYPNGAFRVYVRAGKVLGGTAFYSPWAYAAFTVSDTPVTPTGLSPTGTVATATPTATATYQQSALVTKGRLEVQFATNTGFSANLRSVTSTTDPVTSGSVSATLPEASRLTPGTWYMRARAVDIFGITSAWTATNTLTISHPPSAASLSPSGDQTRGIDPATGAVRLSWLFSDPDAPRDWQTAHSYEVSRNDTGTIIRSATKVTSGDAFADWVVPSAEKDQPLRFRVRLYDRDNVLGAYSGYSLFRASDVPNVAITDPADGGTVATPAPTFTWTQGLSGTRTAASFAVHVREAASGTVLHSVTVTGSATSYTLPTGLLENLGQYVVRIEVTDSAGLTGADENAFTVSYTPPASVPFVAENAYEAEGYVELTWDDASVRDGDFVDHRVYRRQVGASAWDLAGVVPEGPSLLSGDASTFEGGIAGWHLRSGAAVTMARGTVARTGTGSLQVTAGPGGASWMAASSAANGVPVVAGQSYRLSGWVRPGAAGMGQSYIYVIWFRSDGTGISSSNTSPVIFPPANTWTELVTPVLTAPAEAVRAQINLYGSPPSGAVFHVDDVTLTSTDFSFRDWLAPGNTDVEYAVAQTAVRYEAIVESLRDASEVVALPSGDYWLVHPDDEALNVRLRQVTADDFTEEYEEATFTVLGRGRKREVGTRLGYTGTLTAQLWDTSAASAREQRLALEALRAANVAVYLRSPFGDVWQVATGAIQFSRLAGVGARDFGTATVPYSEVS